MTATTDYTRTIGQITKGAQVHLAHGIGQQHVLCRFGSAREFTTITLAETPEGSDICEVLASAGVKISKLCCNCFAITTRKRYAGRLRAATSPKQTD